MSLEKALLREQEIVVRQKRELTELIGFETRNKYVLETAGGTQVGFAAEQRQGALDMVVRQFLGHMRTFDLFVFENDRTEYLKAHHPFRWYFERLEVSSPRGALGVMERRFSIFTKLFDVKDLTGRLVFEMMSGLFRVWTFPFTREGREVAVINKKWGGVLKEMFTDADTLTVHFIDPGLTLGERQLLLIAALFIDLRYFENNQGRPGLGLPFGD